MLEASVKVAQTPRLICKNEMFVLRLIGKRVAEFVKSRIDRGVGALGPLPHSKLGNPPLKLSNQLYRSIGYELRAVGKSQAVSVRPFGDRSRAASEKAAEALRTKAKRDLFVRREEAKERNTGIRSAFRSVKLKGNFRVSHVRSKGGGTNAAVAAILQNLPHDVNGIRGKRGRYVVFKTTDAIDALGAELVKNNAEWVVDSEGKK